MAAQNSTLPPDLFDATTLYSLASTVAIAATGILLARMCLPGGSSGTTRFLFIWHAADALCHAFLEGSFLYHCFLSWVPADGPTAGDLGDYYPTPFNYLGHGSSRIYGPQAGGANPFAQLWMVYARADKRWAGIDLAVVSLEILTVFLGVPLCGLICYLLAKRNPMANVWMIVLATMELYGGEWRWTETKYRDESHTDSAAIGFITFCPEWLVMNLNLDTSNFMYKWIYLVFFNMLWVFIPAFVIAHSMRQVSAAFKVQSAKAKTR
jgi:hypothetical protein